MSVHTGMCEMDPDNHTVVLSLGFFVFFSSEMSAKV